MQLPKKIINYSKQNIFKSDIDSVSSVLRSNFLTQGPKVEKFEKKISEFCKSRFAVACNSATSALHLACLALGLKKDDIVWTNPISFVASANCAVYCGAKVDYIDIDIKKFNITFDNFNKKLLEAKKKKKLPKILILVDYAGFPCDLDKIYKVARQNKIFIIQDSSHSFGARFKNNTVGNCKYSDITVFSFHPVKIITTGEGGIATTNNLVLYDKMMKLRTHGIVRNYREFKKKNKMNWYYEQQLLGFNYRMSDIEASLGLSQLKRIKTNLRCRKKIAQNYIKKLDNKITLIASSKDIESSYHLFPIYLDKLKIKLNRDKLYKRLLKKRIKCQVHYIPIFLQPFFFKKKNIKKYKKMFPNSIDYYNSTLSLPMYYGLTSIDQNYVIETINKLVNEK